MIQKPKQNAKIQAQAAGAPVVQVGVLSTKLFKNKKNNIYFTKFVIGTTHYHT